MRHARRAVLAAALALAPACGGGGDGGTTQPGPVASVTITTPVGAPTIGALGRTVQFAAQAKDAAGTVVGSAAITWASATPGVATVSGSGLVTAVANGTTQITATASGIASSPRTVTVSQATATITVSSIAAPPDTLFTTGRQRQFSALAADSTGNALASQPAFAWTSADPTIATVGASTGLVAAVADGTADIHAAAGAVTGTRPIVVRRYPATFTLTPTTASITTQAGTQLFTGTAQDSTGATLTISWTSRATGIVTVSPATGTTTTATAAGNGSTHVIMASGGRSDSASVTVSGQPSAPSTAAVTVGDNFFRSVRNSTQNPAVDTVAVGGTVTWTWSGVGLHSVESTGSPSFTSSTTKSTGTYQFTFNSAGTYTYDCVVHGSLMTGTVVVK